MEPIDYQAEAKFYNLVGFKPDGKLRGGEFEHGITLAEAVRQFMAHPSGQRANAWIECGGRRLDEPEIMATYERSDFPRD